MSCTLFIALGRISRPRKKEEQKIILHCLLTSTFLPPLSSWIRGKLARPLTLPSTTSSLKGGLFSSYNASLRMTMKRRCRYMVDVKCFLASSVTCTPCRVVAYGSVTLHHMYRVSHKLDTLYACIACRRGCLYSMALLLFTPGFPWF
jgi:hypothetical protein